MKKISVTLLTVALILTMSGCSTNSYMLKSYKDTALNNSSNILHISDTMSCDFFAEDLVVFPKSGITVDENAETTESEETESEAADETDELEESDETSEEDIEYYAEEEDIEEEEEDIDANVGMLADLTDLEGTYNKNIYDRVFPASTTKIMTALLVLENIEDLTEEVTFTDDMMVYEEDAQLCNFEIGDVLTVDELLYAMLIYSGNDASQALAVYTAGSISAFADMMNARAAELGCVDTHFTNPCGLHDNDHYTSAYDLYLIFNECLKYPHFEEIIRQRDLDLNYKGSDGEDKYQYFISTNEYFDDTYDYPDTVKVLGGKTGTTSEAGCCLILYNEDSSGEKSYVSCILGADTYDQLYSEMNTILSKISN